ncbi:hypothetical protein D3C84_1107810 [compost metagenome]
MVPKWPNLRTQNFSAFQAAGCQHFTAVFRAHSFAETMYLLAFAHIRFERRSHVLHLPYRNLITVILAETD